MIKNRLQPQAINTKREKNWPRIKEYISLDKCKNKIEERELIHNLEKKETGA